MVIVSQDEDKINQEIYTTRLWGSRGILAGWEGEEWQMGRLAGDEGESDWRDELSVVVGEHAELFASPGQEGRQSGVRVVWDADHVLAGPHLQTD